MINIPTNTDHTSPNNRDKQISQYSIFGSKIKTFNSVTDAVKLSKVSRIGISKVLNGKQETAGGFLWVEGSALFTEPVYTEDQLQAFIFKTCHNKLPQYRGQLWSTPNGGYRNKAEANKLKSTGLVAGMPDLNFYSKGAKLMFFELKKKKGVLSDVQKIQKRKAIENDVPYFIVRTPDQFFYGLITTLMRREELNKDQSIELFKQIQGDEGIIFFGMNEEQFQYEVKIFNWLFGMPFDSEVVIGEITAPETREKFVNVVKKFINFEFDVSNGFQIVFNNEYYKIIKQKL